MIWKWKFLQRYKVTFKLQLVWVSFVTTLKYDNDKKRILNNIYVDI